MQPIEIHYTDGCVVGASCKTRKAPAENLSVIPAGVFPKIVDTTIKERQGPGSISRRQAVKKASQSFAARRRQNKVRIGHFRGHVPRK